MAIKFFCENPDCDNYQKIVSEGRIRYQMIKGNLVPEIKKCSHCREPLSVQETKEREVPQISIGRFAGMTPDQKKEVLKKRTAAYDKKNDTEGIKNHYKTKAINKFFGK